jgi:signal recognition particle subunit SRP54
MKRTEAIIDSMTKAERQNHKIIDASRKTRIAKGSGMTISDVNGLIRQYEQMKKMMQQMNRGGLFSKLAGKAMGGMGGGLGGLLGGGMPGLGDLGGMFGNNGGDAEDFDNSYEETKDSLSKKLKKKKRHKKRK